MRASTPGWPDICTPALVPMHGDADGQSRIPRALPRPGSSILVVDSDPRELSRAAAILEAAGYRVAKAGEFADAKRYLDAMAPDLLLTGLRLGAYNGLHLIVRSRARQPGMAAVLMDHAVDTVLLGEAEHNHATFLLKPWSRDALLDTVLHALGRVSGRIPDRPNTSPVR